jgi:histidinol-phosphate aminotransferase
VTSEGAAPRAGLRDVDAYVSPQLDVAARLNTNECPYPLPAEFASDLAQAVADVALNRYPDGRALGLREELAERVGHSVEGTWVANGSNEILTELLLAYGGPDRTAMTFEPTYLLHARLAWISHTRHVVCRLSAPWSIGDSEISSARDARPNVVFVCSPNNPTGNSQAVDVVDRLAGSLPRSLVIVDEAYIEFGGKTAQELLGTRTNVVIVRTFSKAFALAGARIGYCLAAPDVVEDLERVRLPYHLSSLSQAAGLAALRHATDATALIDAVRRERDRVLAALGAMPGVEAFPSDANFVLFRPSADRPAKQVWRALLERGVLVRDLTSVVPEGLRVTAGTSAEVDLFLNALREVLA